MRPYEPEMPEDGTPAPVPPSGDPYQYDPSVDDDGEKNERPTLILLVLSALIVVGLIYYFAF